MASESSLERVLSVLNVFSEDRLEWSFDALMAELGYSRPTLYRYIRTLKDAGFLIALPGARFTLGPKVVELDYLMRKSDPLILQGTATLQQLSRRWPCTALLVRWYGSRLLCVASECSVGDPISSYPRGRPMPLARGAISRTILAFLPKRRQIPLVADNLAVLRSLDQGQTVDEVLDSLRKVRRAGYAVAHGEVTKGVIGISAPVFQDGPDPVAALCTTLTASAIRPAQITEIGEAVRAAAHQLSQNLSGTRDQAAE